MLDKIWKQTRAGINIITTIIIGLILIFALIKGQKLWHSYYENQESNLLLESDLIVAKKLGFQSKLKLKQINKEYKDLLQKHNLQITAYLELLAEYDVVEKKVARLKSNFKYQKPNGNIEIKPEPKIQYLDGCSLSTCYSMLEGEFFETPYNDSRININIKNTRIKNTDWESDLEYNLKQKFKLKILSTTNRKTKTKNYIADLIETDQNDKPIGKVKITDFTFISDEEKSGFQWWDPALSLGIRQPVYSQGTYLPMASLGFSFSKYYYPKIKFPIVQLFQFNIAIDPSKSVVFSFSPASYNLGHVIPIIKDAWIGIDIGVNIKRQISIGFLLTTNL